MSPTPKIPTVIVYIFGRNSNKYTVGLSKMLEESGAVKVIPELGIDLVDDPLTDSVYIGDFFDSYQPFFIFMQPDNEVELKLEELGHANRVVHAYKDINKSDLKASFEKILAKYYNQIYQDYAPAIYSHKAVNFKKRDKDVIKITGNIFVVGNDYPWLLHFVTEIIGQVLFLRKHVENLSLYIILNKSTEKVSKFSQFLMDYMGARVLVLEKKDRFEIDSLYYMYRETNNVLASITPDDRSTLQPYPDIAIQDLFIDEIRTFFQRLPPGKKVADKIFLSGTKLKSQDGRSLDLKSYKKIEDFFTSRGYLAIDQTKLNFKEQIDLVRNATHIATISGATGTFALAAKPESRFISINPSPETYFSPYGAIFRKCCDYLYYPYSAEDAIKVMSTRDHDKI